MADKPTRKAADDVIAVNDDDGVIDVEAIKDMHRAHIEPGLGGLCGRCYPRGWPEGATGLGCQHGSWTRTAAHPSGRVN